MQSEIVDFNKTRSTFNIRKRSVKQFASLNNELQFFSWDFITNCADVFTAFNMFYDTMYTILNRFFPERSITITSRDPYYVTSLIIKPVGL